MNKAKVATKKSPSDTITSLPENIPTKVMNKDIKAGNLKSTITRLRKKGHKIEYTEKGCPDYVIVTRLK